MQTDFVGIEFLVVIFAIIALMLITAIYASHNLSSFAKPRGAAMFGALVFLFLGAIIGIIIVPYMLSGEFFILPDLSDRGSIAWVIGVIAGIAALIGALSVVYIWRGGS
jgi:Ca2+/H+ antiporter